MATNKFGWHSGSVHAKNVYLGVGKVTPAATSYNLDASKGDVLTLIPAQSATINAVGVKHVLGKRVTLIITTSGTNSYTLTFGTGFVTTGTLATGASDAKVFVIDFVSNGTSLIEVSRTTAM